MNYDVSTGERGVHAIALTPNVESVVQFADDISTVEIINMDGAGPVYLTVNGAPATVAGRHTRLLPAAIGSIMIEPYQSVPTKISLISPGSPTVSVARA